MGEEPEEFGEAATPAIVIFSSLLELKLLVASATARRRADVVDPGNVASKITSTSLYCGLVGAVPTSVRLFGYHTSHCEASVGFTVALTVAVLLWRNGARLKEKN